MGGICEQTQSAGGNQQVIQRPLSTICASMRRTRSAVTNASRSSAGTPIASTSSRGMPRRRIMPRSARPAAAVVPLFTTAAFPPPVAAFFASALEGIASSTGRFSAIGQGGGGSRCLKLNQSFATLARKRRGEDGGDAISTASGRETAYQTSTPGFGCP